MAKKKKCGKKKKPYGKKKKPCKKKCKKGVGSRKGGKGGKKKITGEIAKMTPVAVVKHVSSPAKKKKKGKKKKGKKKANTTVGFAAAPTVKFASRARPSPVMGRIYFGSGFGGGGLVYGGEQVGGGYSNLIRTSTNPDFPSTASGDYLTRAGYGSMSGAGIGAVFSSVFKTIIPIFKGLLKAGTVVAKSPVGQAIKNEIVKSGLKTGIGVVGDALRGENIKKSAKSRVVEQVRQFPGNVKEALIKVGRGKAGQKRPMTDKPPKSSSSKWKKKKNTASDGGSSRQAAVVKSARRDFFHY